MKNPIIQISPTYYDPESVIGGGERYVHELARFLARRHSVILISFGNERMTRMVEGYRLEVFPATTARFGFTRDNPLALKFLKLIRTASVVHVHQISTLVGDLACLAARSCGRPVFVTDHGGGGGRLLQTRLPVMRAYTAAVAQSGYAGEMLRRRRGLKVVTIPGGIDLERFVPLEGGTIEPRILFVGRLVSHKGIHVLIEAFAQLADLKAELVIVGRCYDAAYRNHLESLARGLNVRFVSDADDATVRGFMASSRLTVLPSLHDASSGVVSELMGFTPLESQASGTPVVVSDVGALSEFVERGVSGEVVPQGNADALAAAIRLVWDKGDSMRKAARVWVEQFGWERVVAEHLKIYEQS